MSLVLYNQRHMAGSACANVVHYQSKMGELKNQISPKNKYRKRSVNEDHNSYFGTGTISLSEPYQKFRDVQMGLSLSTLDV